MTDTCYTDSKYPNDKICTTNLTSKIECDTFTKKIFSLSIKRFP